LHRWTDDSAERRNVSVLHLERLRSDRWNTDGRLYLHHEAGNRHHVQTGFQLRLWRKRCCTAYYLSGQRIFGTDWWQQGWLYFISAIRTVYYNRSGRLSVKQQENGSIPRCNQWNNLLCCQCRHQTDCLHRNIIRQHQQFPCKRNRMDRWFFCCYRAGVLLHHLRWFRPILHLYHFRWCLWYALDWLCKNAVFAAVRNGNWRWYFRTCCLPQHKSNHLWYIWNHWCERRLARCWRLWTLCCSGSKGCCRPALCICCFSVLLRRCNRHSGEWQRCSGYSGRNPVRTGMDAENAGCKIRRCSPQSHLRKFPRLCDAGKRNRCLDRNADHNHSNCGFLCFHGNGIWILSGCWPEFRQHLPECSKESMGFLRRKSETHLWESGGYHYRCLWRYQRYRWALLGSDADVSSNRGRILFAKLYRFCCENWHGLVNSRRLWQHCHSDYGKSESNHVCKGKESRFERGWPVCFYCKIQSVWRFRC